MRLLSHPSTPSSATQTPSKETPEPTIRAVYLFRRACIQTFRGRLSRYFNLGLRAIEGYIPFTHWGLLISTELPSPRTKAGTNFTPTRPWKNHSSTFELDVPALVAQSQKVSVGSLEKYFPTKQKKSKRVLYLGTTGLNDDAIQDMGRAVLRYMKLPGGYDPLFHNCQHFVEFMATLLCPDARCPVRADQTFCISGINGVVQKLNGVTTECVRKRKEEVKKFYEDWVAMEVQERQKWIDEDESLWREMGKEGMVVASEDCDQNESVSESVSDPETDSDEEDAAESRPASPTPSDSSLDENTSTTVDVVK